MTSEREYLYTQCTQILNRAFSSNIPYLREKLPGHYNDTSILEYITLKHFNEYNYHFSSNQLLQPSPHLTKPLSYSNINLLEDEINIIFDSTDNQLPKQRLTSILRFAGRLAEDYLIDKADFNREIYELKSPNGLPQREYDIARNVDQWVDNFLRTSISQNKYPLTTSCALLIVTDHFQQVKI